MNFEDLQKTWQSQDAGTNISISADTLLKEVRRNQQNFQATIFWRDVREVVIIFLMALYFLFRGWHHHDWTDELVAGGCFLVCTFFVADRLRQRSKRPVINDSLKACVQTSLHEVNHQICLLKNIFWWYLLPVVVTLGISIGVQFWRQRHDGASTVIGWIIYILFGVLIYWGVYWLNQFAVRKTLEPRRQELETLLASLE